MVWEKPKFLACYAKETNPFTWSMGSKNSKIYFTMDESLEIILGIKTPQLAKRARI